METDRTASGLVAATALVLLLVLIFTLGSNGALAAPDTGIHIGLAR
jgi:hypothetical protein